MTKPLTAAEKRAREKQRRAKARARKAASPTAMRRRCDDLFAAWVRSRGACEAQGFRGIACTDQLQCAHVISRGELGVRWNPLNALCLCSAHHSYFTHHLLRWEIWRDGYLGAGLYEHLRDLALANEGAPNYRDILTQLVLLTEGAMA